MPVGTKSKYEKKEIQKLWKTFDNRILIRMSSPSIIVLQSIILNVFVVCRPGWPFRWLIKCRKKKQRRFQSKKTTKST